MLSFIDRSEFCLSRARFTTSDRLSASKSSSAARGRAAIPESNFQRSVQLQRSGLKDRHDELGPDLGQMRRTRPMWPEVLASSVRGFNRGQTN